MASRLRLGMFSASGSCCSPASLFSVPAFSSPNGSCFGATRSKGLGSRCGSTGDSCAALGAAASPPELAVVQYRKVDLVAALAMAVTAASFVAAQKEMMVRCWETRLVETLESSLACCLAYCLGAQQAYRRRDRSSCPSVAVAVDSWLAVRLDRCEVDWRSSRLIASLCDRILRRSIPSARFAFRCCCLAALATHCSLDWWASRCRRRLYVSRRYCLLALGCSRPISSEA